MFMRSLGNLRDSRGRTIAGIWKTYKYTPRIMKMRWELFGNKMVVKSTMTYDAPRIDYLTWIFERQLVKARDPDELFIDFEHPQNSISRGAAKQYAQQIAHSLREIEEISLHGEGMDVVAMYSTNNVRFPGVDHQFDRLCIRLRYSLLSAPVGSGRLCHSISLLPKSRVI